METYIIKRYAEVEMNERRAAERHQRQGQPDEATDTQPGLLRRALAWAIAPVALLTRTSQRSVGFHPATSDQQ